MRNISGSVDLTVAWGSFWGPSLGSDGMTGAFVASGSHVGGYLNGGGGAGARWINLDASRAVPIAPEVRPANMAVRYFIKALN